MGKGFKHGNSNAGGSSNFLGFKVIAYTSDQGFPEAQNDNDRTIAVITNTPIKSVFASSRAPSYISVPMDIDIDEHSYDEDTGDIWIRLSENVHTTCIFGRIELDIMAVYQRLWAYDGEDYMARTEWVPLEARIYQGDLWENITTNLYYFGYEYIDLTGGWVGTEDTTLNAGTFAKDDDTGYIIVQSTSKTAMYAHTQNAIDLTFVKEVHVDLANVTGTPFISVHAEGGKFNLDGRVKYVTINDTMYHEDVLLDVSDLKGKYHITVGAQADSMTCSFSQVYLKYMYNSSVVDPVPKPIPGEQT